jgi:hypothetical protein
MALSEAATMREIGFSGAASDTLLGYRSRGYKELTEIKLRLVAYLVDCGFTVLYQDVDIVHLRRFPHHATDETVNRLHRAPLNVSMLFQEDWGTRPAGLGRAWVDRCAGYFIARPSARSSLIFNETLALINTKVDPSDQEALNRALSRLDLAESAPTLPADDFLAGRKIFVPPFGAHLRAYRQFAQLGWSVDLVHDNFPFLIHANAANGKVVSLRRWSLMFSDNATAVAALGLADLARSLSPTGPRGQ